MLVLPGDNGVEGDDHGIRNSFFDNIGPDEHTWQDTTVTVVDRKLHFIEPGHGIGSDRRRVG